MTSYAAFQEAVAHCRSGRGPAFVHGHVIRPYSHSLSDEEKDYRSEHERKNDALRDPIGKTRDFLLKERVLDAAVIDGLEKQANEEIDAAVSYALDAALPGVETIEQHLYSEVLRSTDKQFETKPVQDVGAQENTMADLINACLRDELQRDERIVVFGEDVADCSREEHLDRKTMKGKGDVFKVTAGLQSAFGSERVFNSPLAEASILGRAIGYATRGMKPVVEIQFMDFIWSAMQQLRSELGVMRWRSNGAYACPVVVRVATGGYLTGGGIYHSQCGESIFTHTPGVHVVFPSNALDANGLLRTAIRCDDPVLFLEHKRLYREPYGRAVYPGREYMIPFGKAKIVREGSDVTIVTYGALVPRSLQAAQRVENDLGIQVEIIDLRTLNPFDWETIATSVRKTNRVIVAYEDMLSWGYGAEIVSRIADDLFDDLDAPVKRVGARDTFVAYQPVLEDAILPQPADVYRGIVEITRH